MAVTPQDAEAMHLVAEAQTPPLIDRARAGESDALELLFTEFRPRVYRFALARTGDPFIADDVTQETLMAMAVALPTFEDRGVPLSSWVFGIAANKLAMEFRSASRRAVPADLAPLADRPSPGDGPEDLAVLSSQVQDLLEPLHLLSERDRTVLLMRVVGQLSAAEVAAALGMTAGAVRVAQHRALQTLRSVLQGGGQHEGAR